MKKIFIMIIGLTLSACSLQQDRQEEEFTNVTSSAHLKEFTQTQETNKTEKAKSVELKLDKTENKVQIILLNPKGESINSVRSWLSYDKRIIQIKNLNLNSSTFNLAAPQEYLVDKDKGIIKIGLTSTKSTNSTKILVGEFEYENNSNQSGLLQCYDYGDNTDSHCTVLSGTDNILIKPKDILLD